MLRTKAAMAAVVAKAKASRPMRTPPMSAPRARIIIVPSMTLWANPMNTQDTKKTDEDTLRLIAPHGSKGHHRRKYAKEQADGGQVTGFAPYTGKV